jgi:hypothetical protein
MYWPVWARSSARSPIADRLAFAQIVVVERGHAAELGQSQKRIARPSQGRQLGQDFLGPRGDVAALGSDQNAFAEVLNVMNHIHAFEHRPAVVLHQDRHDPLPDEAY